MQINSVLIIISLTKLMDNLFITRMYVFGENYIYVQGIVTGPLGLSMFERPGELWLNHSNVNFKYVY